MTYLGAVIVRVTAGQADVGVLRMTPGGVEVPFRAGSRGDSNDAYFVCANVRRRRTRRGGRGVLDLGAADELEVGNGLKIVDHVASPEIVIDDAERRFILYFHGRTTHEGVPMMVQHTFVATSADGLDFNGSIEPVMLGNSYFRVFNMSGHVYAIANSGTLYRAPSTAHPWEPPPDFDFSTELWTKRPDPLIPLEINPVGGSMLTRHSWVWPQGDELRVFFTRVGDVPERIVVVRVDVRDADFGRWKPLPPVQDLLRAELPWEGGDLEPAPSKFDWALEPVNQLRDSFVFEDEGRFYLLYTGAGEAAIGIAALAER
jgi:hypothetical protein